uniref:Uncharacterized protein n=1 Tax=Timema tahoe TaxID=61484 RepID=A0A7R9IIT1_9NEOP|nr:unnamed protein product [Timema tahoe]
MRKAQEDAEVLRSLVIPLEEEIQRGEDCSEANPHNVATRSQLQQKGSFETFLRTASWCVTECRISLAT